MSDLDEQLYQRLAEAATGKAGAEIDFPFGEQTSVYKVGGKMFALLSRDKEPAWFSLKLPPALNVELQKAHPDQVLPGYYLNKTHWSTFVLDGVLPLAQLAELLDQSHGLVCKSLPVRLRPGAT
jgi:predicted DNA-binding protein (MmcQ/YjbR family)